MRQKNVKKKKVTWKQELKRHWQLYLFLLLPVLWLIVFCYAPMGGIIIAFKNYSVGKGIWKSQWVGIKWFRKFFATPDFGRLLKNTLALSFYSLLAGFPAPIILAIALNCLKSLKVKKIMQTLTYAPYFISTVVLVGIVMQCLNLNIGVVNKVMEMFGADRVDFLGKASYFRTIYVFSGIWQSTGFNAIIYIATLGNIDQNLVEASQIDGANMIHRIWNIELPTLRPIITMQLILAVGGIMGIGFEKAFLMQNPLNQPVSEIISTYVYKRGLIDMKFSFATAVGLFNSVVNFLLLITANKLSKKFGEESLW